MLFSEKYDHCELAVPIGIRVICTILFNPCQKSSVIRLWQQYLQCRLKFGKLLEVALFWKRYVNSKR